MKAAVFFGKEDLRIQELCIPEITRKDDVLIKVKACGICGTDMHIFDGDEGRPKPLREQSWDMNLQAKLWR